MNKLKPRRGNSPIAVNIERLWEQDQRESGEIYDLTELASRSGMNQPTLYRIYTGEIEEPKAKTIKPLADYFEISVAKLKGEVAYASPGNHLKPSAKARSFARRFDTLAPRQQQVIMDLIDILVAAQPQKKASNS